MPRAHFEAGLLSEKYISSLIKGGPFFQLGKGKGHKKLSRLSKPMGKFCCLILYRESLENWPGPSFSKISLKNHDYYVIDTTPATRWSCCR